MSNQPLRVEPKTGSPPTWAPPVIAFLTRPKPGPYGQGKSLGRNEHTHTFPHPLSLNLSLHNYCSYCTLASRSFQGRLLQMYQDTVVPTYSTFPRPGDLERCLLLNVDLWIIRFSYQLSTPRYFTWISHTLQIPAHRLSISNQLVTLLHIRLTHEASLLAQYLRHSRSLSLTRMQIRLAALDGFVTSGHGNIDH
jgi:hypothetical protein